MSIDGARHLKKILSKGIMYLLKQVIIGTLVFPVHNHNVLMPRKTILLSKSAVSSGNILRFFLMC